MFSRFANSASKVATQAVRNFHPGDFPSVAGEVAAKAAQEANKQLVDEYTRYNLGKLVEGTTQLSAEQLKQLEQKKADVAREQSAKELEKIEVWAATRVYNAQYGGLVKTPGKTLER